MKKWHDRKKKEFVIDVDSMVLHHMEMISHLSLTKFKQFGRGCVLVTAPYTKFGAACNYGLTHIKTEAGAVKDDVDVVVDYVAE